MFHIHSSQQLLRHMEGLLPSRTLQDVSSMRQQKLLRYFPRHFLRRPRTGRGRRWRVATQRRRRPRPPTPAGVRHAADRLWRLPGGAACGRLQCAMLERPGARGLHDRQLRADGQNDIVRGVFGQGDGEGGIAAGAAQESGTPRGVPRD